MSVDRRSFLKGSALGLLGGAALPACKPVERKVHQLISQLETPASITPGRGIWYATTCRGCDAGCGLHVKVVDGRAKVVAGNPEHPLSQGGVCRRGHAQLQALYHPDRFRGPARRSRRGAALESISWQATIETLSDKLGAILGAHRPGERGVAFVSGGLPGHLHGLVTQLLEIVGEPGPVVYTPFEESVERHMEAQYDGLAGLTTAALSNADMLLNFGAPILETWGNPMQQAADLAALQSGRGGRYVHAEPRLSMSAAAADLWLPVRPGAEAVLALGLASVIARGSAWEQLLQPFHPARTATSTGILAPQVEEVGRMLRQAKAPLVVAGGSAAAHTHGSETLRAIVLLNQLLGAGERRTGERPGKLGGPLAGLRTPQPGGSGYGAMTELVSRMKAGAIQVLLLHDCDPVFTSPAALGFREALERVPLIVSFASHPNDSSAYADLIAPDHCGLEAWGDQNLSRAAGQPMWGLQQPVVVPRFDTRATADVLIEVARALLGQAAGALPHARYSDMLRAAHAKLPPHDGDGKLSPGRSWEAALAVGGVWALHSSTPQAVRPEPEPEPESALPRVEDAVQPQATDGPSVPPSPAAQTEPSPKQRIASWLGGLRPEGPSAEFAGDPAKYPLHLLPYAPSTLHDGRWSHLPWLQEAPEPVSRARWGAWVEINPTTAQRLGIKQGDQVRVRSAHGQVELPVLLYPGIRPDVVAVPTGQGRKQAGRYGSGVGANPFHMLAPLVERDTGALAWAATRVQVQRIGEGSGLILASTGHGLHPGKEH